MNEQSVVGKSLSEVVFIMRASIDQDLPMTVTRQPFSVNVERNAGGGAARSKYTVPVHKTGDEKMAIKLGVVENVNHVVTEVYRDGLAYNAGIQKDDYIVAIDDVRMVGRPHDHVVATLGKATGTFSVTISRSSSLEAPKTGEALAPCVGLPFDASSTMPHTAQLATASRNREAGRPGAAGAAGAVAGWRSHPPTPVHARAHFGSKALLHVLRLFSCCVTLFIPRTAPLALPMRSWAPN